MMTDNWTLVSSISTALSEQLYDAVAVYTPVAYMDSSDLSIDSTGTVNISIPEVEATGVTYTNKATNETFTSYPTVAGDYVAKVSLKYKRNWDSLYKPEPCHSPHRLCLQMTALPHCPKSRRTRPPHCSEGRSVLLRPRNAGRRCDRKAVRSGFLCRHPDR